MKVQSSANHFLASVNRLDNSPCRLADFATPLVCKPTLVIKIKIRSFIALTGQAEGILIPQLRKAVDVSGN